MSDDKAKPRPAAAAASRPAAAAAGGAGAKAGSAIVKRDDAEGEGDEKPGKLRWILGWVVLPGTVVGAIFGGCALVGAHFHDSWFTRAVVWVVEIF